MRRCSPLLTVHRHTMRPFPATRPPAAGALPRPRSYRYYDLILGAFVAVLLCSNLIGPGKTVPIPFVHRAFGAGNLFFPISYIFGDVLTEVYGYARARRVIWAGFGAMVFAAAMSSVILWLPPYWGEPFNQKLQPSLEVVFGNAWRITAGSLLAYWAGDFVNSFVLAKMKIWTRGRFLWTRTIGSTVAGQLVDSLVFYPLAFAGIWEAGTLVQAALFNWSFKVGVEAVLTPVTYAIVRALKRAEQEDYYDIGTDFTPFSLRQ